jgi:hypothetical protein
MVHLIFSADQDSGFSIVTQCDLDSSGFKVQWGQDLPYTSRLALRPTHLPLHWVPGLFPRGKAARVWPLLTTHPHLAQRLNVGRVIPLLPFCASHGMLQGDFYLYMYLICNNESLATVIIIEWRKLHCYSYVVWYIESGNNRLYNFYIFWVKQPTTVFCLGAKTEGTKVRVMENWT